MMLHLTVAVVATTKPNIDLSSFLRLNFAGFGRYQSQPALFLERDRGGSVVPVPISSDSVMAVEQALAPGSPAMLDVLLHAQATSKRDDCLFDNLPWDWNPSPQAKRDAFARFSGRGYPRGGYGSPYHLVLDMIRRDACADVARVLIEDTSVLGDQSGVVVGGALLLQRRLPQAVDSGAAYAMGAGPTPLADGRWYADTDDELDDDAAFSVPDGAVVCECTAEEALGLALACNGGTVLIERRVWEQCSLTPQYNMQRGKMRIEVMPQSDATDLERSLVAPSAGAADAPITRPPPLPWEIKSAEELESMTLEEKAMSALAAGLRLPRARDASDGVLTELLEPLLDEDVRRQIRVRRAVAAGDDAEAAALEAATSRRGQLLAALRVAVAEERFGEAAELSSELRVESSRRMDVTQDEGSYDRYLDQDDWYAKDLARQRERQLQREREQLLEKEEKREAEARKVEARQAKKVAEAEQQQAEARAAEQAEARAAVQAEQAEARAAEQAAAKEAGRALAKAVEQSRASAAAEQATAAEQAAASEREVVEEQASPAPPAVFRFDTAVTRAASAPPAPPAPEPEPEPTWGEEMEASVRRAMILSFDNYPPQETEELLNALVNAAYDGDVDAERSLRKLMSLTLRLEALSTAASRGADGAQVADEASGLCSEIRMWGKDGERYVRGAGGEDSWLGWLDGLKKGL